MESKTSAYTNTKEENLKTSDPRRQIKRSFKSHKSGPLTGLFDPNNYIEKGAKMHFNKVLGAPSTNRRRGGGRKVRFERCEETINLQQEVLKRLNHSRKKRLSHSKQNQTTKTEDHALPLDEANTTTTTMIQDGVILFETF